MQYKQAFLVAISVVLAVENYIAYHDVIALTPKIVTRSWMPTSIHNLSVLDSSPQFSKRMGSRSRAHTRYHYLLLAKKKSCNDIEDVNTFSVEDGDGNVSDTVRVRIWRALASGEELTLKQLGRIVGECQLGNLSDHLSHVEKQAKTLKNKNPQWKERRGLDVANQRKIEKLRLITRRGNRNEVFIRLG